MVTLFAEEPKPIQVVSLGCGSALCSSYGSPPWRRPLGVSVTRTLNGWHDWSHVKHAPGLYLSGSHASRNRVPLLAICRRRASYSLSTAISCQWVMALIRLCQHCMVEKWHRGCLSMLRTQAFHSVYNHQN